MTSGTPMTPPSSVALTGDLPNRSAERSTYLGNSPAAISQ